MSGKEKSALQGNSPDMDASKYGLKFDSDKSRIDLV